MILDQRVIKKYEGKSISQLIKIAEKHFNAFIRKRDSRDGRFVCISCQRTKDVSLMHAGHYLSAGHNAKVRFDEDNVNGQCSACNTHLHGNQAEYRRHLVRKVGLERVEMLEGICRMVHKWDRFSLIYIIETYKEKIKTVS